MKHDDPALDVLKQDPQAAQLLADPEKLRSLLSSPETKQLVELLTRSGGEGLSGAARAAAQGKPDALMALLGQVMASQEGSRAVEELKRKTGQ